RGRILAKNVYKNKWNTENLVDNNDYGIVIISNGKAIANMNVQIRKNNRPLKSEIFFGKEHWKDCLQYPVSEIAEISGLSIDPNIESDLRNPLLMLLCLTAYNLIRSLGIKVCTTVQLRTLIHILMKRLHLPFSTNEVITKVKGTVPNDKYWNGSDSPRLYYLNLVDNKTVETFNLFFCYLNSQGIQTAFKPRFAQKHDTFSSFRNKVVG
ncbi:MAG: hypothetical protein ACRC80_16625, partial [Waterburya sp.]